MTTKRKAGHRWLALRQKVLARDNYQCQNCGSSDRLQVDHIHELRHGGAEFDAANCMTLCHACHATKTNAMGNRLPNALRSGPSLGGSKTPARPGFEISGGSGGGRRLAGTEPPGAPSHLPAEHPDRAGSRVDEFKSWLDQEHHARLHAWQALVSDRLLEVDDQGLWCWATGMVLVPRQSGKTFWLSKLCEWLGSSGLRVIVGAQRLQNSGLIIDEPLRRLREVEGVRVRQRLDAPTIWWENGGQMTAQATNHNFARGYTADVVVIDEVQGVPDDARHSAEPAQLAVPNPLMILVGTAPTVKDDGELYGNIRSAGLAGRGRVCLIEWSAPDGSDWRDEEVWRAASPLWTPGRLRQMRDKVALNTEDTWRPEYLCQPVNARARPWMLPEEWDACHAPDLVPPSAVDVIAVEEQRGGGGACVAVGWRDEDLRCVLVTRFGSLDEAWAAAPKGRLLVGQSLLGSVPRSLGARSVVGSGTPGRHSRTCSGWPRSGCGGRVSRWLRRSGTRWSSTTRTTSCGSPPAGTRRRCERLRGV